MLALLRTVVWQNARHHPWRTLAAVVAVMLGVALGLSVQLINASALSEFSRAVRTVQGQPDLELRASHGTLPESLYGLVATQPAVALAGPWLDVTALARSDQTSSQAVALRVLATDTLSVATMAPALMPRTAKGAERLAMLAPDTLFLNAAALKALQIQESDLPSATLRLQSGAASQVVKIAGTISAPGTPTGVMDIGAAQDLFARAGELSRIDLQLREGEDLARIQRDLQKLPGWPRNVLLSMPGDTTQRVDNLSRAYRVNLTVLALVALFTGAFLVYSVLALGVAQRAPQLALIAVLGVTPQQRRMLVLAEAGAIGLFGSALGIALGTALAALALCVLGGDLGGGYFAGVQPQLQWSGTTATLYGALGVLAALIGGWWPARQALGLPPAQTLKGLGAMTRAPHKPWLSLMLLAASACLAMVPPVQGIPVAAYVAVGLLLTGGIALLPWMVQLLLQIALPFARDHVLLLLTVERAHRMRDVAAVTVGGVVASLSLAVALTVMVTSFRASVSQWLETVVPAPMYVRALGMPAGDDAAIFSRDQVRAISSIEGIEHMQAQRVSSLRLNNTQAPLTMLAKPLGQQVEQTLVLVDAPLQAPSGTIAVYVSEAVPALYNVHPGDEWPALSNAMQADNSSAPKQSSTRFFVAGVWRDYVRQFGAIVIDASAYEQLTGDARASDLAIWPSPGADLPTLQQRITAAAPNVALEFTTSGAIRARSLAIFDRTFAVTYWLQIVAIGIGLFGVAASFSAQVLARRKEFGLLAHLGLTRAQILAVVAGEGAAWTCIGAITGTLLGIAVSAVLIFVVNPQSFHWTMDLHLPWLRLALLALSLIAAGTLTAWIAGRAAAGKSAILAVKEDW
ncbi:ABC transporter permease [Diaphorobacter sp. HDW4A]|uniref:FtsX-like permease family protein n=1 Tax=Diaphorobacter sp. HDW4A TaxID=2714924 RepID=UPI00140CFA56|nr:ABC transporter permease [Diaphorobacter sp. HDW4A]QIL83923.1 ABC transporter permease [Diaphorobacter sp. HDW4A]